MPTRTHMRLSKVRTCASTILRYLKSMQQKDVRKKKQHGARAVVVAKPFLGDQGVRRGAAMEIFEEEVQRFGPFGLLVDQWPMDSMGQLRVNVLSLALLDPLESLSVEWSQPLPLDQVVTSTGRRFENYGWQWDADSDDFNDVLCRLVSAGAVEFRRSEGRGGLEEEDLVCCRTKGIAVASRDMSDVRESLSKWVFELNSGLQSDLQSQFHAQQRTTTVGDQTYMTHPDPKTTRALARGGRQERASRRAASRSREVGDLSLFVGERAEVSMELSGHAGEFVQWCLADAGMRRRS